MLGVLLGLLMRETLLVGRRGKLLLMWETCIRWRAAEAPIRTTKIVEWRRWGYGSWSTIWKSLLWGEWNRSLKVRSSWIPSLGKRRCWWIGGVSRLVWGIALGRL